MTGSQTETKSYHYVECKFCPPGHAEWSVIVDDDGDVVQLECKRCGGTGWERGLEASHV